ncbi:MAG: hypothetical protein ABI599_12935, partial [Flavobacteriales bacterium]
MNRRSLLTFVLSCSCAATSLAQNPIISIGAVTGPMADFDWGLNTSGTFTTAPSNEQGLWAKTNDLDPDVLRFPGGTISNFYHPTANGYGLVLSEINTVAGSSVYDRMASGYNEEQDAIAEGRITQNHRFDIITLAQGTSSKVMFCANILTGTVNQAMTALNTLVNAGVNVVGVELGNEMYLNAYSGYYPTVQDYLADAQPFATAISAQYPNMPIALSAFPPAILKGSGPYVAQRINTWNNALAAAPWATALALHCYPRIDDNCPQTGVTAHFNCAIPFAGTYATSSLDSALRYFEIIDGRDIWVSEWNVDGPWSHYGNTLFQALYCAEMFSTMSRHPSVTQSVLHNLLSYDAGFNVVQRNQGPVYDPLVNYYTVQALEPFFRSGNKLQSHTIINGTGVYVQAFKNNTLNKQNLLLVNRSNTSLSLANLSVPAVAGTAWVVGGSDVAEGTAPNDIRSSGNIGLQTLSLNDVHSLLVPPYAVVMLEWTPVGNGPIFASTFDGTDGCTLVATSGNTLAQTALWGCGTIAGGKLTCTAGTNYPCNFMVRKVVLKGVTFQSVQAWRWVNERIRFSGVNGQLWDPITQQVFATVQANQRYNSLTFQFTQPVLLTSVIGFPAGFWDTAPMTIESIKVFP